MTHTQTQQNYFSKLSDANLNWAIQDIMEALDHSGGEGISYGKYSCQLSEAVKEREARRTGALSRKG